MRKIIIIISCILLTASCIKEIEMPIGKVESKVYLECFPYEGADITYIKLARTVPTNQQPSTTKLKIRKLSMKVNGRDIEVLSQESNGKMNYYTLHPFLPEDEVELIVEADGLETAYSKTRVLEGPVFTLEREISKFDVIHRLSVTRPEDGEKEHQYGFAVRERMHQETKSHGSVISTAEDDNWMPLNFTKPFVQYEGMPGYGNMAEVMMNGRDMVVFQSDDTSEKLDVEFRVPFKRNNYVTDNPSDTTFFRYSYEIEVYVFDKETYLHLNPKSNQFLIGAGLTPPYTNACNVTGGYGMLGSAGMSSSGWLPNVDESLINGELYSDGIQDRSGSAGKASR